jgi:hypothetical protein
LGDFFHKLIWQPWSQERTLDKKFKIRKEALTGLALIYKKHLSDPLNVPEATKKAVTWMKDRILHGKARGPFLTSPLAPRDELLHP